ncbi:MAG: HAMP domain-containing histidine kinase [Verrucomicrobia bacterium]|nr:HAMP domain-containing histidine kinase [Verrucomicrobiota bacterium]
MNSTCLSPSTLVPRSPERNLYDLLDGRFFREMRSFLTPIIGYASLLQAEPQYAVNDGEMHQIADTLAASGGRLLSLIQSIEQWDALEKIAEGTSPAPAVAITLCGSAVLQAQLKSIARRFDRGDDLHLRVGPVCCRSIGDRWLGIVTEHLVVNAFKFTRPGTKIYVANSQDHDRYVFSVTDEGPGMTAEQISQIAAFRQFDRSKYEQQGLGLGLRMAQVFAHCSGGTLVVSPAEYGSGTHVTLTLPGVPAADLLTVDR